MTRGLLNRPVLLTIMLSVVVLSSCDPRKTDRVTPTAEREFNITLGGSIEGHPEEGELGGTCSLVDSTGGEMSCDIYNGLQNWKITQASVIVTWSPYADDNRRIYRIPATIAPLTTERVTFKLGTVIPPDEVLLGRHIIQWG